MFPVINEILEMGKGVRITVTGKSMYPFIRENIDSVELIKGDFNSIYRGDIVLILRDNGEYVLHRVLNKKKDCFYIVGDSQLLVEGPIRSDQLIGLAKAVWRKNKKIKCSSIWCKLITSIWIYLFPCRRIIFNAYRWVYRIL